MFVRIIDRGIRFIFLLSIALLLFAASYNVLLTGNKQYRSHQEDVKIVQQFQAEHGVDARPDFLDIRAQNAFDDINVGVYWLGWSIAFFVFILGLTVFVIAAWQLTFDSKLV
jgi:disulfide bond formation protein DsbB